MKKILYIGNQLKQDKVTVTSIDTLSLLLKGEGFDVRTASDKKNKMLRLFDMCYAVFSHRKNTDVVLIDTYSTANFYYALAVAWCCKKIKKPYIPILHGGNLPHRLKNDKEKSRFLFGGAKVNVSPSLFLKDSFNKLGYTNVTCIPNTIQLNEYPFKIKPLAPSLLWVRSFAGIYNPMLALEVLEVLTIHYPDAKLCMVGPEKDGMLQSCKKYAESKNLNVTFTGKLTKEEWIALAEDYSIFINTTNFDNTPVSVIEAMALGFAIVSTNVGGIPYLLNDEKEAVLVNPNDKKAFTDAIIRLLQNAEMAKQLSLNARKKSEKFDWEKVKRQWIDVLK